MPTTSDELGYTGITRIAGQDESAAVDVRDVGGTKYMRTEPRIVNVSSVSTVLSVGTSAAEVKVGGSRLANRKEVWLENVSSNTIFFGWANTVTTSGSTRGHRLFKDEKLVLEVGPDEDIWVIAGSASNDLLISERS